MTLSKRRDKLIFFINRLFLWLPTTPINKMKIQLLTDEWMTCHWPHSVLPRVKVVIEHRDYWTMAIGDSGRFNHTLPYHHQRDQVWWSLLALIPIHCSQVMLKLSWVEEGFSLISINPTTRSGLTVRGKQLTLLYRVGQNITWQTATLSLVLPHHCHTIVGSAADICKVAMKKVAAEMKLRKIESVLVLG